MIYTDYYNLQQAYFWLKEFNSYQTNCASSYEASEEKSLQEHEENRKSYKNRLHTKSNQGFQQLPSRCSAVMQRDIDNVFVLSDEKIFTVEAGNNTQNDRLYECDAGDLPEGSNTRIQRIKPTGVAVWATVASLHQNIGKKSAALDH